MFFYMNINISLNSQPHIYIYEYMGLYIRIYEYDLTTDAWYVVSLSMNSLTSSFCSKLDFMKSHKL